MNRHTADVSPYVMVVSPGMRELAERVAAIIEKERGVRIPRYALEFTQFQNGEWFVQIPHTVRRQHVFFFHPLQHPTPNDALMQMLITNDALKRASVAGITLVVPYLSYLRQDRKDKPRVPISARLIADLIESNDAIERVITADMHADQEQGFFSIPVDNLTSMKIFEKYIGEMYANERHNLVVVAPDFGGAVRARRFAKRLGDVAVAIFEKRRPRANASEVVGIVGESVSGKHVVMFDDMIDTGGSIRGVMSSLRSMGARDVIICATHGIFSAHAEASFADGNYRVVCTDSIPRDEAYRERHAKWLTILSMDELLANTVYEASLIGGSVSKLIT